MKATIRRGTGGKFPTVIDLLQMDDGISYPKRVQTAYAQWRSITDVGK
jgi:hypothetical protein